MTAGFEAPITDVYESIYPSERFVNMAKVILAHLGDGTEYKTRDWSEKKASHTWSPVGSEQQFTVAVRSRTAGASQLTDYTLEHDNGDSLPTVKYRVRNGRQIRLVDNQGRVQHLDAASRRSVGRQSLSILSSLAQREDHQLLRTYFRTGFIDATGGYILSHHAYGKDPSERLALTDEQIADAILSHNDTVFAIQDELNPQSQVPEYNLDAELLRDFEVAPRQKLFTDDSHTARLINTASSIADELKRVSTYGIPQDTESRYTDALNALRTQDDTDTSK